jgi:hypothetical protein
MKALHIAQVAHAINLAYSHALGDDSHKPWDEAPDWQRNSAIAGVDFHLSNPDAGPEASHESWLAQKQADGWTYGEVKDEEAKTHPCIVPFAELPEEQQAKDYIFRAVVHALAALGNDYVPMDELEARLKAAVDAAKASAPVASPAANSEGQGIGVAVEYIGKRDTYTDSLYGTGAWARGQVKRVPFSAAMQMLRHPDQYKQQTGEVAAAAPEVNLTPQKEEDTKSEEQRLQDIRDSVNAMDVDGVKTFVKTKFNQNLHHNIGLDKARAKALQLIDQFGVA